MTTKPDNELRIRLLEQQLQEVRAVVDALRLNNPNGQIDQIIRPARTCFPRPGDASEIDIPPGYPEAGTVVPIKFLDVDHAGLNTETTKTERSASQQALAATLDGTLPDLDSDGVAFRYRQKWFFLSGGMTASSSTFPCDNVFTFYEHDFTPVDDCFLLRRRFVSLTVVNNCLDEVKTDWEVIGRVMSCDASFSESSDTPTECPDCIEHVWSYDNPTTSSIVPGFAGPQIRITVSSDDPLVDDWCLGVSRRFTVLLENVSPNNPNPFMERFYFKGHNTLDCVLGVPYLQIGMKNNNNPIASAVTLLGSQYTLWVFHQRNWIEITSYPYNIYSADSVVVEMPCEILEKGESTSFWIDMEPYEFGGNPAATDFIFGIWNDTGISLPDVTGPQIGYSCTAAPTGRCCKDGVCTVTTEAACTGIGGTWSGPGTDCTGPPCPA